MKKVYIVLTHTGTILSRVIRKYTKNEFTHVSIALDQDLKRMYSFGRLNPYNPFWGGFVHESIHYGTFKRFKNTKARIYSLEVTDEQYNNLKYVIEYIKINKKSYNFNILGLFGVAFKIRRNKKFYFYCAEFVKYVLEQAKIEVDLPALIKPEDFKMLNHAEIRYQGKLKDYNKDVPCLFNNLILLQSSLSTKVS